MSWLGVKWYYGPEGDRRGPFSKKEIQDLIETGVITPETRVREKGEKSDYPAIKTEFSVCFPHEDFITATEDAHVPNFMMWLAVLAPLFFIGFLYHMYFMGQVPARNPISIALFTSGFMIIDNFFIARKGYKMLLRPITYTIASALIFFSPMIYFYYRNKQLRRSHTSTWASAACLLLLIGINIAWPFLENREIEERSVRLFDGMLQPLRPEITAEVTSASVQQRLPGMKFEVVGHLSDGQEMKITLVQSWQQLHAYSEDGERITFAMPNDIAAVFLQRHGVEVPPTEQNAFGIDAFNRRNFNSAAEWFRKAAGQGYAEAQYRLGVMYASGRGVERNYAQAVEWYRKAAAQGHAQAQNRLGWMYANGSGVERDYTQAVKWYRKAAVQGNTYAQNNLGWMYEHGYGVERDYRQAIELYRKAAAQGNVYAQNNLGWLYANGRGVERDYRQAAEWNRKAAEQGHVYAQYRLGTMYANGRGVERDYEQAVMWYRKAAAQGNSYAEEALRRLRRNL